MPEVIGPGASKGKGKYVGGQNMGPGGVASDVSVTTKRGYEPRRLTGLRTDYKENGTANNSKAGR